MPNHSLILQVFKFAGFFIQLNAFPLKTSTSKPVENAVGLSLTLASHRFLPFCSFTVEDDVQKGRIPEKIQVAKCDCENSSCAQHYRCRTLFTEMIVIYLDEDAKENKTMMRVQVGCACVGPEKSHKANVLKSPAIQR